MTKPTFRNPAFGLPVINQYPIAFEGQLERLNEQSVGKYISEIRRVYHPIPLIF